MTTATDNRLKRAKKFLKAVREALKHVDEIHDTTNEWTENEKTGATKAPPLLKQSATWSDAVDPETFERFEKLVDFMRDALFGVDCDCDSAVSFVIVDRAREETQLPISRVPRVGWDEPLIKQYRQLRALKLNLSCLQERVSAKERGLEEDISKLLRKEERLSKAEGCHVCLGKGWVDTDFETWNALDFQEKCKTEEIGCNRNVTEAPKSCYSRRTKFRLFCECQGVTDVE